ncbi:MAG: DUF4381 domain-containing protein [Proteobacteria bacterium]|nr:DUF4381 domain-containing protein [Pseudomonadota bacterium]
MNPQDPLAALHPLRDPGAISWWPLAPGWWVLIALAVLAIAVLAYYLLKRYRANAYRRLALQQLVSIHAQLGAANPVEKQAAASDTNALLKAVALRIFPRHDIAALSGEAWLEFLNKSRRSDAEATAFAEDFATAVYAQNTPDIDTEQLFQASKNWIIKHRASA